MKTLFKQFPKLLGMFAFCLIASGIQAQINPPERFEKKEAYVKEEVSFYKVNDLDYLHVAEKVKLKTRKKRMFYESYILPENRFWTKITHIDSENVYEDWMRPPGETYFTPEGTFVYDKRGEEILNIPSSGEPGPTFNGHVLPNLPSINDEFISELLNQGAYLIEVNNEKIVYGYENMEITYQPNHMYIESSRYNEEGSLEKTKIQQYQTLPTGQIVLEWEKDIFPMTFMNGGCGQHIVMQYYNGWDLGEEEQRGSGLYGNNTAKKSGKLISVEVGPNPASDVIQIMIETENGSGQEITNYGIYNSMGEFMTKGEAMTNQRHAVDVKSFTPGTYILKVYHQSRVATQKFIITKL